MTQWEVIVGNVGRVCDTADEVEARTTYSTYVSKSREGDGRAGGEDVYLMKDGEVDQEHCGTNQDIYI